MQKEKDIKLGTAAPDDEAAKPAVSDADKYYYPPGTTEPVLRPEFANQPEPKAESGSKEPSGQAQTGQDKGK